MKSRARMIVWWPKLDKEIEDMVSSRSTCQANRPLPPLAPLHPCSIPERHGLHYIWIMQAP